MQIDKIQKRNLDNDLLQYLRTIDNKISYDDLSPDIVTDIKNIQVSEESNRYVKYNDEELRRRVQALEENKQNITEAITEEFIDKKLEIVNSNIKIQVSEEMNGYVKNESNSISEYLLSKDLQKKINSRYNNNRVYGDSFDGDDSMSGDDLNSLISKINEIENTSIKNTSNIAENKKNINSDHERLNDAIEDISSNITSINTINNQIKQVEESISGLSDYVENECLFSDDVISFYQLDKETQKKFERIRYNDIKISLNDLDSELVNLIQNNDSNNQGSSNNSFNFDEIFNGQRGQVYYTKEHDDGSKSLDPSFIFIKDAIVISDSEQLEVGKGLAKERNLTMLCDMGSGIVYTYNPDNETLSKNTEKTINDVLSGKFFIVEPQESLSYYDQEQGLTDLVCINMKLEETYGTKEGYSVIRDEMSTFTTDMTSQMDTYSALINEKVNAITSLQQTTQTQQNTINSLQGTITTLQQNLGSLKTTVNNQATTIASQQKTITSLQQSISGLEQRISTLEKNQKG